MLADTLAGANDLDERHVAHMTLPVIRQRLIHEADLPSEHAISMALRVTGKRST